MADALPVEGGDFISYGEKHPFDLVIFPFLEIDADMVRGEDIELGGLGSEVLVGEINAISENCFGIRRDRIAQTYEVGLGDLFIWVCEHARPLAVIGEE